MISVDDLHNFLLSFDQSSCQIISEWNWKRYIVGAKMFALVSFADDNKPILTIKNRKAKTKEYRLRYKNAIVPSLELEPTYWNSILLDSDLPDSVIKRAVTESYNLIFSDMHPTAKLILSNTEEDHKYGTPKFLIEKQNKYDKG